MTHGPRETPRSFLILFNLVFLLGAVVTESERAPRNIAVLVFVFITAQMFQNFLFGSLHLALDRAGSKEGIEEQEVYYRGSWINKTSSEKRELKFMAGILSPNRQLVVKAALGFLVVVFGTATWGSHVFSPSGTSLLQFAAAMSVVPIASFYQYLIPLFLSAGAVTWVIIGAKPYSAAVGVIYVLLFLGTLAAHQLQLRHVLFSDEPEDRTWDFYKWRHWLGMALIFVGIYFVLNLIVPDPSGLNMKIWERLAEKTNQALGQTWSPKENSAPAKAEHISSSSGGPGQGNQAMNPPPIPLPKLSQGSNSPPDPSKDLLSGLPKSSPVNGGTEKANAQRPPPPPAQEASSDKSAGAGTSQGAGDSGKGGGQGGSDGKSSQSASGEDNSQEAKAGPESSTAKPQAPPKLVNDDVLKILLLLFKVAVGLSLLGMVIWVYRMGKRKALPRKNPKGLDREEKTRLISQWNAIKRSKLGAREDVIKKYSFFLELMAAAKRPKENYVPPMDYQRQLTNFFPDRKDDFSIITLIFSDAFYGEQAVNEDLLKHYNRALRSVIQNFLA